MLLFLQNDVNPVKIRGTSSSPLMRKKETKRQGYKAMLFQQLNYSLQFSTDVQSLSNAFLEKHRLHYFVFIRWFSREEGYILLVNNPNICEAFFKQGMYQKIDYDINPFYQQDGASLWDTRMLVDSGDREMFQFLQQYFSLPNGITLVRRHANYNDYFFLTTTADNHDANDFYLNQLDTIEKFCTDFVSSGNKIIANINQNRMHLPLNDNVTNYSYKKIFDLPQLTRRETECLYWSAHGKSAIEIGIILKISPRTVEQYIENSKKKLGCYKLTHAIYNASKMGLI